MTFGMFSGRAFGPYFYYERRQFALHLYARYYRSPHPGFRWRLSLRVGWRSGGRYVLFLGGPNVSIAKKENRNGNLA